MKTQRIYFDHNATAPLHPAVLAAMLPVFSGNDAGNGGAEIHLGNGAGYGNASSIHSPGQRARGAIERARAQVAALIGARPAEIVFTSGGTESNNTAIFGVIAAQSEGSVTATERKSLAKGAFAVNRAPHSSRADRERSVHSSQMPSRTEFPQQENHGKGGNAAISPASSLHSQEQAAESSASWGDSAPHIVTTAIEHHAVLHACEALQQRAGAASAVERSAGSIDVTYVPVGPDGVVDPEAIRRALRPETVLVSVMHANNELGAVQPIAEIARILREENAARSADSAPEHTSRAAGPVSDLRADPERKSRGAGPVADLRAGPERSSRAVSAELKSAVSAGRSERPHIYFHTDAVQSAGKISLDVNALGVDLLSLSAHKFGGPQGVGALYIRGGVHIQPLLYGGPNERSRRAGTENVAGIVGLGKAAEIAREHQAENAARVAAMRDRLESGLLARIPGARVNSSRAESARVHNTTNLLLPGVDSESLVIALDLQGLACSAGAACSSGTVNPSHVLTAIGLTQDEARASIRLSLGPSNTDEEVTRALDLIPAAVAQNRQSAVYNSESKAASAGATAPPRVLSDGVILSEPGSPARAALASDGEVGAKNLSVDRGAR